MNIIRVAVCILLFVISSFSPLLAQATAGVLQGQVTDPTGAVVPETLIVITSPARKNATARSGADGRYEIKGLAPGTYRVRAVAKGFSYENVNVAIAPGQTLELNIVLAIKTEGESVTVQEEAPLPTLDVSPENNAGAIVIQGKDLEALSDDPDQLQSELEALAGPSAGPSGGQIYIDGFTGGQLPPKSSIREIRINQNPFSAEYDKLGYGRIEIFTKPGTNQFHGQFFFTDNNSIFNSVNPFLRETPPPYSTEYYNGAVSGPMMSKKASFFFNIERRNIQDFSVVNAIVLGPSGAPQPFTQALANPSNRTNISPRFDFQLGQNNTLTVRYQFVQLNQTNNGVGQFALPSQAFNVSNTEQTLQLSDTQTLSAHVINETRFQYIRERNNQTAASAQPDISVIGAFTGGGNALQNVVDNADHYELQNLTSIVHGRHMIKFGGRLRVVRDANHATSNFNGTFTFPSITAYASGVPSQFLIVTGQPVTRVSLADVGVYAEDEWRLRPNMSLSYGLRFESQGAIHDVADFAPRFSFSWGLGHGKTPPKTILRAGWGIFYDRFTYDLLLQAERLNGIAQTQTTITSPDFYPTIPAVLSGSVISPTIYRVAPDLLAPANMQTAASVERQVTKNATVSVTYLNSRGEHQLFLSNINAPLPGTYNPNAPTSGVRPLGGTTNVYQYNSAGIFRQNQLIANARFNLGTKVSLFGYYTLNYADSDLGAPGGTSSVASTVSTSFTSGSATASPNFVSDSYDPMADYGRASFDVRHRGVIAGTINTPYAFRINPFILIASGHPFNVTLGQDLSGTSIFNQRPSFANALTPASAVQTTAYGTFNNQPGATETRIPINYGTGTAQVTVNLRLSKTFGIGPKVGGGQVGGTAPGGPQGQRGGPHGHGGMGPGGGLGGGGLTGAGGGRGGGAFGAATATNRRYSLTFSAAARNLFNHPNLAPPVGNLSSPLFGQANALSGAPFSSGVASRRFDLQALFTF